MCSVVLGWSNQDLYLYMLCFYWGPQGTCLIYVAGLSRTQVMVIYTCTAAQGGQFKILQCILCCAAFGVLKEHV